MKSTRSRGVTVVGVISDTHGLLRPEALAALRTSELIVHAGDIGDPEILERLAEMAPVVAVRGNNDRVADFPALPERVTLVAGGVRLHVVHEAAHVILPGVGEPVRVVVTGHSHRPSIAERDGVLHLNPGSAGPRRFRLPVTVARLEIRAGTVRATIENLVPVGGLVAPPRPIARGTGRS